MRAKTAVMQILNHNINVFLNHCKFERNFSSHTIKSYRLDLAQFGRFTAKDWQAGDPTQVILAD